MSAVANIMNAAMRELIPQSGKEAINTFKQNTVIFSKLYKNKRWFEGGYSAQGEIRETLKYKPLPGGPHIKGTNFANENTENIQPLYFNIKLMEVTVVVDKTDIRVFNRGKEKIFDIAKEKLADGMESLGLYADIGSYLPGQGASYSAGLNGLTEICNDGTKNNAIGGTVANYGGLVRSDTEHGFAVRGKTMNLNGAMTHRVLLQSMTDATPDASPTFGLTTPNVQVFIEDRFQPQQRFTAQDTTDIGIPGWKFHNKTVFTSRYVPGAWVSAADATTGENRVAFEYVKRCSQQSGTSLSAYPTITGETFFWLNTDDRFMHLYVSNHPVYNFGFDDFIGNDTNDKLVGRFRLACNIAAIDNRRQYEINQIKV